MNTCERFHGDQSTYNQASLQLLSEKGLFRLIDVTSRTVDTIYQPKERYFALSYIWGKSRLHPRAIYKGLKDRGSCSLRHRARVLERPTTLSFEEGGLEILPRRKSVDIVLSDTKWNTRGWTYQERALSPHTLFFTGEEVFFQCSIHEELTLSETMDLEIYPEHDIWNSRNTKGQAPLKNTFYDTPSLREALCRRKKLHFQHWKTAVLEYTDRNLTHSGDRLNGFAGLAQRFRPPDLSDEFMHALSGLPLQWFWFALAWKEYDPDLWPQASSRRIEWNAIRTRKHPTWSWVGWTGMVTFTGETEETQFTAFETTLLDPKNIKVAPTRDDLFWDKWPATLEPLLGNDHDTITLHLWAKFVPCYLLQLHDGFIDPFVPVQSSSSQIIKIETAFRPHSSQEGEVIEDMRQSGRSYLGWITKTQFVPTNGCEAMRDLEGILFELLILHVDREPRIVTVPFGVPVKRDHLSGRCLRPYPLSLLLSSDEFVKVRDLATNEYIQLQ